MKQMDARNTLHHTWDANKSKYTDGEPSFILIGTLVTKTHDFSILFDKRSSLCLNVLKTSLNIINDIWEANSA